MAVFLQFVDFDHSFRRIVGSFSWNVFANCEIHEDLCVSIGVNLRTRNEIANFCRSSCNVVVARTNGGS